MSNKERARAKRGESQYLVRVEGKDGTAEQTGRVYDTEQGVMFPPKPVQSILARGYWVPFDGEVEVK